MFLLGDESCKNSRFPWMTLSLVVINVMVFAAQQFVGDSLTVGFSMVPAEITQLKDLTKTERVKMMVPVVRPHPRYHGMEIIAQEEQWVDVPQYAGPFPIFLTMLTSMFLHGNWVHLIGNMWFLIVFGRNVESALNHDRFLAFYLGTGIFGGICQVLSDPSSVLPCLGASGAISGIMGAYIAVFPFNKVRLWLGWYVGVIELPAIVVLGGWFLLQYLSAFASLDMGIIGGGVAYWDHLGGFVSGVIAIRLMVWKLRRDVAREALQKADTDQVEETASTPIPKEYVSFLPPAARPQTRPQTGRPPSQAEINTDALFERAAELAGSKPAAVVPPTPPSPDPFRTFLPPRRST